MEAWRVLILIKFRPRSELGRLNNKGDPEGSAIRCDPPQAGGQDSQTRIGSTPKAAGRGAERLADPERTGHLLPTLAGTKFSAGLGGHCGWEADLG